MMRTTSPPLRTVDPLVIALFVLPSVASSPAAAVVLAGALLVALLSAVAFAAAAERWFVAALQAPMMIVGWLVAITAVQLGLAITWPAQPVGAATSLPLLGACALLLPVTSLARDLPSARRWRSALRAGLAALLVAGLLVIVQRLPVIGGAGAHWVLPMVAAAVAARQLFPARPSA